jgi:hypothetical protein
MVLRIVATKSRQKPNPQKIIRPNEQTLAQNGMHQSPLSYIRATDNVRIPRGPFTPGTCQLGHTALPPTHSPASLPS